jgi:outer membrane protein
MMNLIKLTLLLCLVFADLSFAERPINTSKNEASNFLYGIGMVSNKEIYKGYDTRTMVLPFIGYKGEHLTVFGPFISYKVKEFNNFEVSVKLSPRFQGFDESDSYIFEGMKDRKSSIDAGVDVNYKKDDWRVSVYTAFDVLGRSNGFEVKSAVGRTFRFGPVFIEPSVSLSYLNSDHVDYYYGVLDNEVNSNRGAYQGSAAKNTSINLSVATPIILGGFTRFNVEYVLFDSSITDSPLVEDDSSLSVQLFFTKNF